MHIIRQIENHHSPPISIDEQQLKSLTEKVNSLLQFLEGYNSPAADSDEADPLEIRISDATYAAEDVIESYIVDNILLAAAKTDGGGGGGGEISCINFYEDLQAVIEEFDLIEKEVAVLAETVSGKAAVEPQPQLRISARTGLIGGKKSVMVGMDCEVIQIMDWLTGGNPNRQIIPIVGMGGIGKTTLVTNVFQHPLISEHFDICVWATISQNCDIGETLRNILTQASGLVVGKDEKELGVELHKCLWGRRYLLIMDDLWSTEDWDMMKNFFPDCENGSRILVTTRLSHLASYLTSSNSLDMRFLDEASSWNLFSLSVFGEESFPSELEEIGKKIVEKCKGLPLAIVVIGGLLAKSLRTLEYWEHVEENLTSIVNSENEEYCLRILKMSYNYLPAYLKPCFLYMGAFSDPSIRVSRIIRLWVCEGFLRPLNSKSLERIANDCLEELVDRNLIIVDELGSLGKMKYCKIHDLVKDMCLKEAQRQRFYYVFRGQHSTREISSQRHTVFTKIKMLAFEIITGVSKSMPHLRSYVCKDVGMSPLPRFRLLRTLHHPHVTNKFFLKEDALQLVNLHYIKFQAHCDKHDSYNLPYTIYLCWNLHTLIIFSFHDLIAPIEIWKMRQLRHVECQRRGMYLPDPRSSDNTDSIIMENLETLKGVRNFYLNEDVVKRIPNIKKLSIRYKENLNMGRANCLSYLQCLNKLESFVCSTKYGNDKYIQMISFPHSLKKLSLVVGRSFPLDETLEKIGALPFLMKLRLWGGQLLTRKWETVEGQFPSLKYLSLGWCKKVECWTIEGEVFPHLEQLHLVRIRSLNEIPSEVGEIPTLKSIELENCSESVVLSAKNIQEEQEEIQGVIPFDVRVVTTDPMKYRLSEVSEAKSLIQEHILSSLRKKGYISP